MTEKSSVEGFMRFLIEELTDEYSVDDEGYIVDDTTKERMLLRKKPVMVIKDKLPDPDCNILSPINENLKVDVVTRWLYAQLTSGVIRRLFLIFAILREEVEEGEDADIPANFRNMFSDQLAEFTAATNTCVTSLFKDPFAFLNINYDRRTRTSKLRCAVFEPDNPLLLNANGNMPNTRKKAIRLIRECMTTILPVAAGNGVSFSSISLVSPKLESFLMVLNSIYTHLNQAVIAMDGVDSKHAVDLTELGHHIGNLEDYYKRVKWFTGSSTDELTTPAKVLPAKRSSQLWKGTAIKGDDTVPTWKGAIRSTAPSWKTDPVEAPASSYPSRSQDFYQRLSGDNRRIQIV